MQALLVLAASLLAAAPMAAGMQTSPGSRDDPNLKRWAEQGFGPADAKSWRDVGIDPVEAKQWISNGIQFAEWANQWKGEGFGPADAGVWARSKVNVYTAAQFREAGFDSAEATSWIDRGVRGALRAQQFKELGFGPVEAGEWWRLGLYPQDAGVWTKHGFTSSEALAWMYGEKEYFYSRSGRRGYSRPVYPIEWARQWRRAGFTPVEARLAGSYRVEFEEAAQWRVAGFAFDDAMAWRDSGFAPIDAAREKANGSNPLEAEERRAARAGRRSDVVTSWHSDVTLRADATVDVTETIVVSNGPAGPLDACFPRVFPASVPLKLSASAANSAWPSYHVTSVVADGAPAAHAVDTDARGLTLCIGNAPLAEGAHTFTIHYTTGDRLVSLRDHDRFVFDVIGSKQPMPIRTASAAVHLPTGANTVLADAFAGPPNRKYFVAEVNETAAGDVVAYRVTRPLEAGMRFEVAVSLPKGHVRAGLWQRARRIDRAEGRILSSLTLFTVGLAASLTYFIRAWHRVGRDPETGAVVPVYTSPEGISPALMRYLVARRRADGRAIAATLVRLARAGAIVIREREGLYRIEKSGNGADGCASHEAAFLDGLFANSHELMLGTRGAKRRLRAAAATLGKALRVERAGLVAANARYLWPGLALSIAAWAVALVVADLDDRTAIWAYPTGLAVVVAIVNLTFRSLLRAPTPRGRKLFDGIEGFRRFLDAGYRGTATDPSPVLAAHLPYAIALGIESERASILDRQPAWYAGRSGGFSVADFIASLDRTSFTSRGRRLHRSDPVLPRDARS